MLILYRKVDEQIIIAEDICISVVSVHPKGVRLGISAPLDIPVFRAELLLSSPNGNKVRPEAPQVSLCPCCGARKIAKRDNATA